MTNVYSPVTLKESKATSDIGRHWHKMHLEHSPSCLRTVKVPPPLPSPSHSTTMLIAVSRSTHQAVKTNSQHRTHAAHGNDRCHLENRTGVLECLTELN